MNEEPRIVVSKNGMNMYASTEVLLAAGAITEEQAREMGWTPPAPVPRLRRWKWRAQDWWYSHRPTVHLGPRSHEDCA